MATTHSHDDEGEQLVNPSRLRFGGDAVVHARTEKLENEKEEVMENMLRKSMHNDHDAATMVRSIFRSKGSMSLETTMARPFKRRGFTPSRRSCERDTRPAAELGPSKASLKVLRGALLANLYGSRS